MPAFWPDVVRPAEYLDTLRERRKDVYERIDEQRFGWKIVIVAGVGFLTDSYDIFAVNMVLPMLEIVYWQNNLPAYQQTAINLATLVGTIIGQLTFGILADRYGRKRMYGYELIIVIVATMGLALCSKGAQGSVNILAWVISWRLLMGIGIGADYPLSAVIVSEFAPRKHRARMLAAVFFMQPVGQLLANVVAIIATTLSHRYISQDSDPANCVGDCMGTTDKIWRWIVGLGAVPPAIALLARLFIPESPRYTLEVEKDSNTAQQDANAYFTDPFALPNQEDRDSHLSEGEPTDSREAGDDELATEDGPIPMESLSSHQEGRGDGTSMDMVTDDTIAPPPGSPNSSGVRPIPSPPEANEPSHNDNGGHDPSEHPHGNTKTQKASWREFFNGFHDFLFKDSINDSGPESQMDLYVPPEQKVRADAHGSAEPARRWTDGNWTDLAGTALSWFWLDFSFFFLGVNSWKIVSNIWATPSYPSVYQLLIQYSWRALISVSISSIIGGAIFIKMAKYRHSIQTYGFLIEAAFLVAVGVTFVTLLSGRYFAAIIVLYFFSQLFFDLGPNTSTFIIPAEVFPTQYRATCHGISAASGKLGSIIAQVIAQVMLNDTHSKRLGYVLIGYSPLMILGAIITKLWVPNPCDIYNEPRSLEDLGKGKKARKKMEEDERRKLRAAEQARYGNV